MPNLIRICIIAAITAFICTFLLELASEFIYSHILDIDDNFLEQIIDSLEEARRKKSAGSATDDTDRNTEKSKSSSSASTGSSSGQLQKGADLIKAIWSEDFEAVAALCESEGSSLDVNYNDNGKGTALYRAAMIPETDRMLAIVNLLLLQPGINPNGGTTTHTQQSQEEKGPRKKVVSMDAKQPLKAALFMGNKGTVKLLMKHPDTSYMVEASGLPCSAAANAPADIIFIVDDNTPDCFAKRGSSRQNARADTSTEGGGVKTASSGTTTQPRITQHATETSSASLPSPAPAVLDPSHFNSLPQTVGYYLFSRFIRYSPYIELAVTSHVLLVLATFLFGFRGLTKDMRRKEAELRRQQEQAEALRRGQEE